MQVCDRVHAYRGGTCCGHACEVLLWFFACQAYWLVVAVFSLSV